MMNHPYLERIREIWQSSLIKDALQHLKLLRWLLILGGIAYGLATVVHTLSLHLLLKNLSTEAAPGSQDSSAQQLSATGERSFNYFDFHRTVLARNLFNADGEVPHDENPKQKDHGDEQKSCTLTALPLRLTGTLLHENPSLSVATVVDLNYRVTDGYRQGDRLIDHPATITAIERSRVIIEHQGRRECLEVTAQNSTTSGLPPSLAKGRPPPSIPATSLDSPAPSLADEDRSGAGDKVVVLKDSYVEQQLGEGFAKIIQAARLVPKQDDMGNPEGFRIFGIKPSTLLTRIGLKNGDILTQINTTSLKQPEEGFALYQALQDENEITISLKRSGKPQTIKVRIE